MQSNGYEAVHATQLSLDTAEDLAIWSYARENEYTVISKDEDFINLLGNRQSSPQLIWIRTGNCKNRLLIECVLKMLPNAIELLGQGHVLVEILREDVH